mgnify:CR=1 FL=1|jgi:hypothetical protein
MPETVAICIMLLARKICRVNEAVNNKALEIMFNRPIDKEIRTCLTLLEGLYNDMLAEADMIPTLSLASSN